MKEEEASIYLLNFYFNRILAKERTCTEVQKRKKLFWLTVIQLDLCKEENS